MSENIDPVPAPCSIPGPIPVQYEFTISNNSQEYKIIYQQLMVSSGLFHHLCAISCRQIYSFGILSWLTCIPLIVCHDSGSIENSHQRMKTFSIDPKKEIAGGKPNLSLMWGVRRKSASAAYPKWPNNVFPRACQTYITDIWKLFKVSSPSSTSKMFE